MNPFLKTSSAFSQNNSGQVAVFFALIALPLIAITSASVDYTNVVREKQAIKGALDAAVIAAVNNNAIPLSEKGDFARLHFDANYDGEVTLKLTPTVNEDQVFLLAEGEIDLSFGQIIGINNPVVAARSGGQISTENTICVLALSETQDNAVSFGEGLSFYAPKCTVHSNSNSSKALVAQNKGSLPTAKSFCAVGGVDGKFEPHSKGECKAIEDPYAKVPPADEGVCVKEFLYETGGVVHPVDIAMGAVDNFGTSDLPRLPNEPPVKKEVVVEHLKGVFGEDYFDGRRAKLGNDWNHVEKAAEMGGDMLRQVLALYDLGDGHLHCAGDKKIAECDSFDHPYRDKDNNETPEREVMAEIFDFLYGDYQPDPLIDLSILDSPTISYINGKLYTKGNQDGKLVHISKNLTGGKVRLYPGTYCGGLTVDGLNVVFAAGDYIFKDGPLTFLNGSEAHADNVTFGFLGEGATLNVESESNLDIKAATSGPRKGLAFMEMVTAQTGQDSQAGETVSRITSGGQVSIAGTAYFPKHSLEIEGKNSHINAKSPAVGLIANDIQFRGRQGSRVEIDIDHVSAGIPPILPRAEDGARLIE